MKVKFVIGIKGYTTIESEVFDIENDLAIELDSEKPEKFDDEWIQDQLWIAFQDWLGNSADEDLIQLVEE